MFAIQDVQSLEEIMESEAFTTLQEEFANAAEGLILDPIDNFNDHFVQVPDLYDLFKVKLDFVDQRERLKDPKYRNEIIKMALNFKPKFAGFPVFSRVKGTTDDYAQDWQKRLMACLLRGLQYYPASIVKTTIDELSDDFNSQFKNKDNIEAYDKFKSELSGGSEKHWAMQHCFDRLGVTAYPFADPPLLTGLGDVMTAMYNPALNSKEKGKSFAEKEFNLFVRAVGIFRRVWPQLAKERIPGSFIRGLVAILAMFDKNVLQGTDEWLVEILEEAKDSRYAILKDTDNVTSIGFDSPFKWTSRKNWQGNRFHQNAVQSFALVWNEIRKDGKNNKSKRIPALDENPILGLDNAKFLDMVPVNKS